jgi:hypothetical protein
MSGMAYQGIGISDEASLVLFVSQILTDNGGNALTAHQAALLRMVCRGSTNLLDAHPFTVIFSPLQGMDLSVPVDAGLIFNLLSPALAAVGWIIPDPPNPSSIFSSVSILQWCRADYAVSVADGLVSALGDRGPAGIGYSATGKARPTYATSDATLGGLPSIQFDGVSSSGGTVGQTLKATALTLIAPFYLLMVAKLVSWATSPARGMVSQINGPTLGAVITASASPGVLASSGISSPPNAGSGLNTWERYRGNFTASAADYLRRGATTVTGNFGSSSGATGRQIGRDVTTGAFSNMALWEILYLSGAPTPTELSAFDTYVSVYAPSVSL